VQATAVLGAADPGATNADVVAERFGRLVRAVGMPATLGEAGLGSEDVRRLARRVVDDFANKQRTTRVWSEAEILELLEAAA
jgi:alcohol dehydrogenase class IV